MKKYFISLILLLAVTLPAQDFSEDEKLIYVCRDTRYLGENNELVRFLGSKNNNLVINSLYVLADIADSNTVENIAGILIAAHNKDKKSAAAFALGQIPCDKSKYLLLKALYNENDPEVICSIIDALGKVGDENSLSVILNYNNSDNTIAKAITLAIARFAVRNIKTEEGVNFLKNILTSAPDLETLRYTAYALYRIRSETLLAHLRSHIIGLTKNNDPCVRMWSFSALGYVADLGDVNYAVSSLDKEEDWRVKVNILISLPLYKKTSESVLGEKLVNAVTDRYDDANPNVRHTALRVTALLFSGLKEPNQNLQTVRQRLEWFFPPDKAVEWQDKCEAILAYGTIFKDDVKHELLLKMSETENEDLIPYIIKSFQFFKDGMVYNELTDSVGKRVQRYNQIHKQDFGDMVQDATLAKVYRAYVEVLSALKNNVDKKNQEKIMLILSNFVASKDPSILDVCFTALNDSIYLDFRNNIKMVLLMDYKELVYPKDKDAMILFINEFGELKMNEAENILKENLKSANYDICKASANALKKITGKDYTFTTKFRTDFDWGFIKTLDKKKFAVLKTEKGNIKIKLLPEVALFSVVNFVRLAEKKFYDKTSFHRVVPNFVIQGGDPLNNGYGGPDYSIRSEFSPLRFERGFFGMASEGRDTEGSQFFIMHSPHYHLDGRYTIFGEVVEGMEVVDNIAFSDVLETVTFSEN